MFSLTAMEVKKKWKVKRNIARFPEDFMFELKKGRSARGIFKVTFCDFKRKRKQKRSTY